MFYACMPVFSLVAPTSWCCLFACARVAPYCRLCLVSNTCVTLCPWLPPVAHAVCCAVLNQVCVLRCPSPLAVCCTASRLGVWSHCPPPMPCFVRPSRLAVCHAAISCAVCRHCSTRALFVPPTAMAMCLAPPSPGCVSATTSSCAVCRTASPRFFPWSCHTCPVSSMCWQPPVSYDWCVTSAQCPAVCHTTFACAVCCATFCPGLLFVAALAHAVVSSPPLPVLCCCAAHCPIRHVSRWAHPPWPWVCANPHRLAVCWCGPSPCNVFASAPFCLFCVSVPITSAIVALSVVVTRQIKSLGSGSVSCVVGCTKQRGNISSFSLL